MRILLQENVWREHEYDAFCVELVKAGHEIEYVKCLPFADNFDSQLEPKNYDLCFGSTSFIHLCRKNGYPVFKGFAPIEPLYPREYWVNDSFDTVQVGILRQYLEQSSSKEGYCNLFAKPVTEKLFTGLVLEKPEDADKIQFASSLSEDENEEYVYVSEYKEINIECRFFVINGLIITGSQYRHNGYSNRREIQAQESSWFAAQFIIDKYGSADKAFVMDMGFVETEWKIVELNNFNSSGFYKCDLKSLAISLKGLN